MSPNKHIIEQIKLYINSNCPLVLFRNPQEQTAHVWMQQKGELKTIHQWNELEACSGYLMAPFKLSAEHPMFLLQPDFQDEFEIAFDDAEVHNCEVRAIENCSKEYHYAFNLFKEALSRKDFDKLVLSRKKQLDRPSAFHPLDAFLNACCWYRYSYIFMCVIPNQGIWLGSTPEVLLKGEENSWSTMALAGTQSLNEGKLPTLWSEKNMQEQAYVSTYIRDRLKKCAITPEETAAYPVYAGSLAHLRTDFYFTLPSTMHIGHLLQLLHPTPAVCGFPKEEAFSFICKNEGYDRSYYSGFSGIVNWNQQTALYVNLRCMNIGNETLTLYAGGGLLAASNLDDEWLETEKKMFTMKRLLDL